MPLLPILRHPNAALLRKTAAVKEVNGDLRRLAADMRETMIAARGVGLAAPQVGAGLRLIVADISERRDSPIALANPRVTRREGEVIWEEGCLSVPGVTAKVRRAAAVTVSGMSMDGDEISLDAEELLAVCLQHEIDHLDGILFFDRVSPLKRQILLKKYEKQRTAAAAEQ